MMKNMKKTIYLALIIVFSGFVKGYASNDAGAFLRTGLGVRALSMGGSQVVSGYDGVSGFWNPAKLGYVKGIAIDTMYGNKFDLDLEYSFVGFASELNMNEKSLGGINLLVVRQGIDDIKKSTRLDANNRPIIEGSFKNIDQAVYLSYGYAFLENISAGGSAKYISQEIDGKKGTGVGFDSGLLFKVPRFPVSLGIVYQNIGQTIIEWDSGHRDTISPNLKFGVGIDLLINRFWIDSVNIELASDNRKNRDTYYSQGLEINIQKLFHARFGHSRENLSFGGGIQFKFLRLDYSFNMHDLSDTHWFGVGLDFQN